jgi:hypothetical protein
MSLVTSANFTTGTTQRGARAGTRTECAPDGGIVLTGSAFT